MTGKINKRKGATLAELCVVIAVVVIMAVAIVSFTVLISENTRDSRLKLEASNELDMICVTFENFVKDHGTTGAVWNAGVNELSVTAGGETYLASFNGENGAFSVSTEDGELSTIYTTKIKEIKFDINEKDGKTIFFCRVTYYLPGAGNDMEEFERIFARSARSGVLIPNETGGDA